MPIISHNRKFWKDENNAKSQPQGILEEQRVLLTTLLVTAWSHRIGSRVRCSQTELAIEPSRSFKIELHVDLSNMKWKDILAFVSQRAGCKESQLEFQNRKIKEWWKKKSVHYEFNYDNGGMEYGSLHQERWLWSTDKFTRPQVPWILRYKRF